MRQDRSYGDRSICGPPGRRPKLMPGHGSPRGTSSLFRVHIRIEVVDDPRVRILLGKGADDRLPILGDQALLSSQLFARDASNLFKSSGASGELDLREEAKHDVRYSVEEADTALPVVPAGRVENHSKVFS